ncbi:hypothetical protein [Planococcus donghaensis]|nr:hypothetical protein [Planococcus donghaensis]
MRRLAIVGVEEVVVRITETVIKIENIRKWKDAYVAIRNLSVFFV